MAFPRYSLSGNDAFAQYFEQTFAAFGHDERLKVTASPATTLYDVISRSASPLSTAGTAVEENVTFGTFASKGATSDSEDSDSDDESDGGDMTMDAGHFEVRADGKAYQVHGNDALHEGNAGDEEPVSTPVLQGAILEEAEDEVSDLPHIPITPHEMDFRHTSLPPPPTSTFSLPSPAPISFSVPRRRNAASSSSRVRLGPSDYDAEYESDREDLPSDDEYRPSPPPTNHRKRQSTSRATTRSTKQHRMLPYPLPSLPSPNKRPRAPPPSRNKQASDAVDLSVYDTSDFKCPICDWVQGNQRKPDFLRHLNTHTRASNSDQSKGWWCKGVRVEDLNEFNAIARKAGRKTIAKNAEVKQFRDHMRIGGCHLSFSRRDALKRHLDNPTMACAGHACKAMDES